MIIKSNSTFSLIQTITDQILLIVNGTYSQPVLRVWHISQKEDAILYWNRLISWETRRQALGESYSHTQELSKISSFLIIKYCYKIL